MDSETFKKEILDALPQDKLLQVVLAVPILDKEMDEEVPPLVEETFDQLFKGFIFFTSGFLHGSKHKVVLKEKWHATGAVVIEGLPGDVHSFVSELSGPVVLEFGFYGIDCAEASVSVSTADADPPKPAPPFAN